MPGYPDDPQSFPTSDEAFDHFFRNKVGGHVLDFSAEDLGQLSLLDVLLELLVGVEQGLIGDKVGEAYRKDFLVDPLGPTPYERVFPNPTNTYERVDNTHRSALPTYANSNIGAFPLPAPGPNPYSIPVPPRVSYRPPELSSPSWYDHVVTSHHDGHGLTEGIRIFATDPPGPGGASHHYEFYVDQAGETYQVGYLQFQKGPRNESDSRPGVVTVAVIAALVDQLQAFQKGPFPSRESALAITHLQETMHWLRHRADERAARGVLGHNEK